MEDDRGGTSSAAKRMRDRRLRAAFRHEQLSVRMAVAAALHHSAQRGAGPETYSAPRRQTTATEGEVREPYNAARSQKPPLPGTRPAALREPMPQLGLEHAACPCSSGAPCLAPPALADAAAEAVDQRALVFLTCAGGAEGAGGGGGEGG